MSQSKMCALCQREITPSGKGNFRYCSICRGKIERGEIDISRSPLWITERERIKKRAKYFHGIKMRKERYSRVDIARGQGERICYYCEGHIEHHAKYKPKAKQKFCTYSCAMADRSEQRNLSGFYYSFGLKGNERQREIELETGVRPGTEKRRAHAKALNEARRNGKPWGKTGPQRKKAY